MIAAAAGLSLVASITNSFSQTTTNPSRNALTARLASSTNLAANAQPARIVSEVGPNHRVWKSPEAPRQRIQAASASPGTVSKTSQPPQAWASHEGKGVVEIATGMNYWDGQQWLPSDPTFDIAPDGSAFVADRIQHKIRLEPNLNTSDGAVSLTTPDGISLRFTPVAIALTDSVSGRTAIIAAITNCTGVLDESRSRVIFKNAFDSLCADVVISIDRGTFESDVIFTARLSPSEYGFPEDTSRIQVITEFYNSPVPDQVVRPIYVEKDQAVRLRRAVPDIMDSILGYGDFVIGTGRAFVTPAMSETNFPVVAVAKEYRTIGGRTFLVESLTYGGVKAALSSLPSCEPSSAALTPQRKAWRLARADFMVPKAGLAYRGARASKPKSQQLAALQDPTPKGVAIDFRGTLGGNLNSATVFQGDLTYFVSGPVYCNAAVTIEGGAVFKYPTSSTSAFIQINSTLTCATSAYRPAIFTAADDESVGDTVQSLWGTSYAGWITPGVYYANPALVLNYVTPTLSNLRFNYCQDAIKLYIPTGAAPAISDCQLVDCVKGIHIAGYGGGSGSGSGTLPVNNTLFGRVSQPVVTDSVSLVSGILTECTLDNAQCLVTANGTYGGTWTFYNSVLSHVTSLTSGGGATMYGNTNGFCQSPQFGSGVVSDTASSPFAPSFDGQGGIYLASGQGGFYLRNYSPFLNAGNAGLLSTTLKNDLASRTTFAPSDPMTNDITSSQTLGQQPIRDTDTPDLGYHYPAIDYIINGITINNCTLSVDQGTVLAYMGNATDPLLWNWGVRVNTGGRLIVNGVPTNRVVFARLEAVQESPYWAFRPSGPTVTFEGAHFPKAIGTTVATPMPEAKIRYADFPTLSTTTDYWWNSGYWPGSIAPMDTWSTGGAYYDDYWYEDVANLELKGCLFQGGFVYYISGGWLPRTVSITNNIFERCDLYVYNWNTGSTPEQLIAVNNLFYADWLGLAPVSGANWTFSDNLFDHVNFVTNGQTVLNGPVTLNYYNGYVAMSADHLSPSTDQTATDRDLTSLNYATGPLGRFYLPVSTTSLINHGSRLAKDVGMYHFSTATSGANEGTTQLDIGAHYLSLPVGGKPGDNNHDGIPDFIADANGNGINDNDEVPWSTANNGQLSILSPVTGTTVSGIIKLRVGLGTNAPSIDRIYAIVDGGAACPSTSVPNPARSVAEVDIDTTYLEDTQHVVSIAAYTSTAAEALHTQFSTPVSLTTANSVRYPNWQSQVGGLLNVNLNTPASLPNYTLWFLHSSYAKSYDPALDTFSKGTTGGAINFSQPTSNFGFSDGDGDPVIYSFTELADPSSPGTEQVAINPVANQSPTFPPVGLWCAAYAYDIADYDQIQGRIADVRNLAVNPITQSSQELWLHDTKLKQGWYQNGVFAGAGQTKTTMPNISNPELPQTWPVRMGDGSAKHYTDDRVELMNLLTNKDVRNFYGYSHGSPDFFFGWEAAAYKRRFHQRFRFVFLDGCETATGISLFKAFGMDFIDGIHYPPEDTNPDIPDDTALYHFSKKRPAAFLGWKVYSFSKHNPQSPPVYDALTGEPCNIRVYEAMCNWHNQFLFYWWLQNKTLVEAIDAANQNAMGPNSPVDTALCSTLYHPDGTTESVVFNPKSCLRVFGYGGMRFNDCNHLQDWTDE
jgi:hypothetical protein